MIDVVKLLLRAGSGGHGRVSFQANRQNPKGGPDGGFGGRGGDVILRGNAELTTLQHLAGKHEMVAEGGQNGGRRNKRGSDGQPIVIELPLGTVVWLKQQNTAAARRWQDRKLAPLERTDVSFTEYRVAKGRGIVAPAVSDELLEPLEEPLLLAEIMTDGQEVMICQGGFGGWGNNHYRRSTETTPERAQYGSSGEWRFVELELKLLADIGLVGFPNVGKSTLLSVLTNAKPKVANYPFTTLEPNLGVLVDPNAPERSVVIADIPGLIEGASAGKGLGHGFLRHVDHVRLLVFVLANPAETPEHWVNDPQEAAQLLQTQYQTLLNELAQHSAQLAQKPRLVVVSKADLYPPEVRTAIVASFLAINLKECLFVSAATREGLSEFTQQLLMLPS